MAILQVRDIDEHLYSSLKKLAKSENRSVSQEVRLILKKYMANPKLFEINPTEEFLSLCGAWNDDRTVGEIITDIKKNRGNSTRFKKNNVLFD